MISDAVYPLYTGSSCLILCHLFACFLDPQTLVRSYRLIPVCPCMRACFMRASENYEKLDLSDFWHDGRFFSLLNTIVTALDF